MKMREFIFTRHCEILRVKRRIVAIYLFDLWIASIFCKNLAMTMKTYNERTNND